MKAPKTHFSSLDACPVKLYFNEKERKKKKEKERRDREKERKKDKDIARIMALGTNGLYQQMGEREVKLRHEIRFGRTDKVSSNEPHWSWYFLCSKLFRKLKNMKS